MEMFVKQGWMKLNNVQTIRQLAGIVAKNIREMEKDVPKLEQMSFAVDSISSVYFSKSKGVIVLNDYVSSYLWKPRKRNEVFENEWMGHYTVKAFVVIPLMTKISIIFIRGYDKGYKIFIADENLFVCILIYLFISYLFQ